MARRVFFSFHYERDIWRASIVRNSWVTRDDREEAGFWDASLWEEAQKGGDEAIKRMINNGLENTSVTTVLIGAETFTRQWVIYEIIQSFKRGNGLLGIYIDGIEDRYGRKDVRGANALDHVQTTRDGQRVLLSRLFMTYDWVAGNGYRNMATWVEDAAQRAARLK
jgi:hypothetical protein